MWGCRGQDGQGARIWVSVSCEMVGFPPPSGDLEPANQCAPSKKLTRELRSPGGLSLEKARAVCTNRIALNLNKSPRSLYQ